MNTEDTDSTKEFRLFREFRVQKNKPQILFARLIKLKQVGIVEILITSVSEIIPLISEICVREKTPRLCVFAFDKNPIEKCKIYK